MDNLSKSIVLVFVLVFCTIAHSQKGMGETEGLASEGVIPELITQKGIVQGIKKGPCTFTAGKSVSGTHLMIKSDEAVLNVHLGPTSKVYDFVADSKGDKIEIISFRTKKLPKDHYIAKEVMFKNDTLILRDGYLKPFWANKRGREFWK